VGSALYALADAGALRLGFFLLADLVVRVAMRRRHTRPRGAAHPAPTSVPLEIGAFTPYEVEAHLRPYVLVASVHNLGVDAHDFIEAMEPYRERLWIIDDASTDETAFVLEEAGLRCLRGHPNQRKPAAIRDLLFAVPAEAETIVVLDPDARFEPGPEDVSALDRVVFEFQRTGAAACCPRLAVREDGWLARMQGLEYAVAFGLGRKSLADHSVTSGIAIYRADALRRVLDDHSLSVYAEDLNNALLLLGRGEKVYYDERLVVRTEGKRTWRSWFSQRVGWAYGLLKVYPGHLPAIVRAAAGRPWLAYQYLVYMGLFTLLFHPLKIAALLVLASSTANGLDTLLGLDWIPDTTATDPSYFLFGYLKYTILAGVSVAVSAPRGARRRLVGAVPLYFFYALAQIVPSTVGYLNWFTLRFAGRRIYRDHYQEEGSLGRENHR
jgi:cellulose synthase/poly-beta-1,6-N-acetylglucosamine synthase-like glycosyltransferase